MIMNLIIGSASRLGVIHRFEVIHTNESLITKSLIARSVGALSQTKSQIAQSLYIKSQTKSHAKSLTA